MRLILLTSILTLVVPLGANAQADTAFSVPIEVKSQGVTLRAILHVAAGPGPHATFVVLKGFPGGRSQAFPAFMQAKGFNAISPNFRGQLDSDGTYDVAGTAADVAAIVDYLRSDSAQRAFRIDPRRIAIAGTSAGSYAALSAGAADESVRCVALVVPFNWAIPLLEMRNNPLVRAAMVGQLQSMTSGSSAVRLDTSFVSRTIDAAEVVDLRSAATRLQGHDVLMIGAQRDQTAPLDTHFTPVRDALRAAQATVRDTILDDTHNLPATTQTVFELTATWLRGCVR